MYIEFEEHRQNQTKWIGKHEQTWKTWKNLKTATRKERHGNRKYRNILQVWRHRKLRFRIGFAVRQLSSHVVKFAVLQSVCNLYSVCLRSSLEVAVSYLEIFHDVVPGNDKIGSILFWKGQRLFWRIDGLDVCNLIIFVVDACRSYF